MCAIWRSLRSLSLFCSRRSLSVRDARRSSCTSWICRCRYWGGKTGGKAGVREHAHENCLNLYIIVLQSTVQIVQQFQVPNNYLQGSHLNGIKTFILPCPKPQTLILIRKASPQTMAHSPVSWPRDVITRCLRENQVKKRIFIMRVCAHMHVHTQTHTFGKFNYRAQVVTPHAPCKDKKEISLRHTTTHRSVRN